MPILVILCDVSWVRHMVCAMFNKLVAGSGQIASEVSSPEKIRRVIDWYDMVTRELWAGYEILGAARGSRTRKASGYFGVCSGNPWAK